MFSPLIMASNSSFCRVLHNSFSFTGPYIFRKIFLSNTANALSSSLVSVHDSETEYFIYSVFVVYYEFCTYFTSLSVTACQVS